MSEKDPRVLAKMFDLMEDFLHNGGKNEKKILEEIENIGTDKDEVFLKQNDKQLCKRQMQKALAEDIAKWPQYFAPGVDKLGDYMQGKM